MDHTAPPPVPCDADELRSRGLRATGPRMAVLDAVRALPHSTADTVAAEVRRRRGAVSIQGVYDALAALVGAGLVRRIEPAGAPAMFEPDRHDGHHHVVCRVCGRVADVAAQAASPPPLPASPPDGFTVDDVEVTFWGMCAGCASSASPPPRAA